MRPPTELDDVDWSSLFHAYGTADDVPVLVRALYDADTAGDALYDLHGNVWHQGTVYPATVPAVPFLAYAAVHGADRAGVLDLLGALADQESVTVPVVAAVVDAVYAATVALRPAATDPDARIRAAYVRLAAANRPPLPREVVDALRGVASGDPDEDLRAAALTALARHDPTPDAGEAAALRAGSPPVRLAAALAKMRRGGPPYAPDLVAAIGAHGAGDVDRVTRLLVKDPEAGFTVAGHWVDAGEPDAFWLVDALYSAWRDREARTVALLTAGLPHSPAAGVHHRLRVLELALSRRPGVPPATRAALGRLAADARSEVSAPARRVLARYGDPGLDPPPAALAALPDKRGAVDAIRAAFRRVSGNEAIGLVGSLDPATAATLWPDLIALAGRGEATVVVPRVLGDVDAADARIEAALDAYMDGGETGVRAAAAVAWIRRGNPPGRAYDVLRAALAAGPPHFYLDGVARLGPAGAPLLPEVAALTDSRAEWASVTAAHAYHRITGDADRAARVLGAWVGAPGTEGRPVQARAVAALADMGVLPDAARARLTEMRDSPRRLLTDGSLPSAGRHPDDTLRDDATRLLEAA